MTDEQLDRLVRDADPVHHGLTARLEGAEQQLLEEIVSTPVPVSVLKKRLVRRLAGAVAVAAAVAGVIATSSLLRPQPDDVYAGPTGLPAASAPAISGWELDLKAAEGLPRLLIDEPGWKATSVYGFTDENGSITFENGGRALSMDWYPDDQYQGYYDDRLEVSTPEWTTVANRQASVVTYSKSDFAAMLKPQGGTFVELRTASGDWTRATFDALLPRIVKVDAESFLKALPEAIVTPGDVRGEAAKILADIPLPPNFDVAVLENSGANDPYQFGAAVTGRVTCDWIAEWIRADKAGDDQAREQAVAALQSSRKWKVLHDMNAAGDYPEAIWEMADKVADDDLPEWYKDGLGC
ncbi:hypothetical protein AB0F72_28850 [Actinoplanes sp. NPDC023936]|uniref:hypothetical protein n=1 Tax=Actinoplanes sp. NPDC023936 TaxID=3154910 RepID=UPI0033EE6EA4